MLVSMPGAGTRIAIGQGLLQGTRYDCASSTAVPPPSPAGAIQTAMPLHRGRLREFSSEIAMLQRLSDAVLIGACGYVAAWLRFGSAALNSEQGVAVVIALLMANFLFAELGVYRSWRAGGIVHEVGLLWIGWALTFLFFTGLLFSLKIGASYSRLWIGTWFALAAVLLPGAHIGLRMALRWLRRRGYNVRTVCLVGDGEAAARLRDIASTRGGLGFRVVAWFGVTQTPDAQGLEQVGVLAQLRDYAECSSVDEVWVAVPLRDEACLGATFAALAHSTANLRYVPDLYDYQLLNHAVTEIGGVTMLDLSVSPMQGANRLVKRLEDLVLGSVFLLLAAPAMLIIALAIKLGSPGPVLFKQRRIGWSGREFVIYKFRTMYLHQEDKPGQLAQATRGDPRITPLGRLLRRTSLDELPQLINVVQGRMSLVGPRPHAVEHHHLYIDKIPSYATRHMVKPGITGYAQIAGYRGETETPEKMRKRVEYDVLYIQHWSIALDLKIIAMTLFRGILDPNAY